MTDRREPPQVGTVEHLIAVGVCHDCEAVIGPTHAEDVGLALWLSHTEHETDVVDSWTEVEVLPDVFFEDE